ncbi:hypothetical protein [Nostoc sp.]|uniref:hypothetical protein n=1 Tax=Nostoc sp. TaxID=1180 RepID=UPI002FFBF6FD
MNNTLASTLGELQTKIYWLHDAEKFAKLAETATKIYMKLGYDQQEAEIVGYLISEVPVAHFEIIKQLGENGGFFCGSEIGPVGGRTFLHAYTSAFGIYRQNQL